MEKIIKVNVELFKNDVLEGKFDCVYSLVREGDEWWYDSDEYPEWVENHEMCQVISEEIHEEMFEMQKDENWGHIPEEITMEIKY